MLPAPAHHVTIVRDYGGEIDTYSARVSAYLKRRVSVRITGECVSACTMVAALPADRICVGPKAEVSFHQAYLPNRFDPLDTTIRSDIGTEILLKHYPPALRAWLDEHGGLGPDLITLKGDELAAVFRICPRRDRR